MKKYIFTSLFSSLISFSSILNAQIISTVAGNNAMGAGYSGNGGPATAAELNAPYGVYEDVTGNMYISDNGNNVIREVNYSTGVISTFAGIPGGGFSGDGGPATAAELNSPTGLFMDVSGNLFFAEAGNQVIRKVDHSTGIISTVAGNYNYGGGYSGDGGLATAAELNSPADVKFDGSGNMFIADFLNQVIRRVDNSSGVISTIAGNHSYGSGYSGDGGPATSAELNCPQGIAIDHSGNIFISEHNNNVIRKVDFGTGIISTIAGNHISGYDGDGGPATAAELSHPVGITIDGIGNIFFSDQSNVVIRKIDNTGKISTIAGNNSFGFGYSGDGGPATDAELYGSEGVALDSYGNLFIGDNQNNVIRKVTSVTIGIEAIKNPEVINIYPNPGKGIFNIKTSGKTGKSIMVVFNSFGEKIIEITMPETPDGMNEIDLSTLSNGVYFIQVINQQGSEARRIVIEK